jgi:NADPH:quinone reductase-like Zn-dependent oxidoreductase
MDAVPAVTEYVELVRAVVCPRYGHDLEIRDLDSPRPGYDEVLVRIEATTVNRTDHATAAGVPRLARVITGLTRPRQKIMGTEFAGYVVSVGPKVTEFAVGDAVFGFDSGTQAQFLAIPESGALAKIPRGMSPADAAPTTEGAHYALSILEKLDIGATSRILVYGASGAIGSAAVQLLRHRGAAVTAVCDSRGVDLVSSLGANSVIDYTATDFTQTDERFDAVIDAVGKCRFSWCKPLLKPGAPFLTTDFGHRSENLRLILSTRWIGNNRVRLPIPTDARAHVRIVRDLLAAGDLRPVVDKTFAMDDINQAYRYVGSAQKLGNVVVTVPA